MIVTINKMVNLLEEWANSRKPLINDFYFGNIYDVNSSTTVRYPLMVVDLVPTGSTTYNNGKFSNRVNFLIGFFDQENDQLNVENVNGYRSNNVGEILSDTYQLYQDLLSEFATNTNWRSFNISTTNSDKNYNWKMNDTGDKIWGIAVEIEISGLYNCK